MLISGMRARRLLHLGWPIALTACTALLGDFTVADGPLSPASDGGPDGLAADGAAADGGADASNADGSDGEAPLIEDGKFDFALHFAANVGFPLGDPVSLAYDPAGNIILAFKFSTNTSVVSTSASTAGSQDIGVAKLDPTGKGALYSGNFAGPVNLGDGTPVVSFLDGGGYDSFVVKRGP